ncbi:hypothetical protein CROQUDRAFT_713969 [Cronartium quercuum f. sp. fusiforme G11]|uniref:Uncharacterized protein n=1 Tax=Cronartium quercuum f. sp. fusiforme G11 TaxID=708437 RepID=A0A9P6NPM6_9BASI|nr:hypothetical protein CROQUDRAFT_713969 [Cronartium quercuum f. sp. fusiforme G11]
MVYTYTAGHTDCKRRKMASPDHMRLASVQAAERSGVDLNSTLLSEAQAQAFATDHDPDTKSSPSFLHPPLSENRQHGETAVVWTQGWAEWKRTLSLWSQKTFTTRFWLVTLAGQFVSVCITSTNVETTELINRGWAIPTTQTFFLYLTLCAVYTPLTIWKYGFKDWFKMLWTDGYKYLILAAFDVEGNYAVIKAYQYTDLLSAELLGCLTSIADAWATPVCMIGAALLIGNRYHWTQYLGVTICIAGLGLLVLSDYKTDKNYPARNKALGDGLMLIGATLYAMSNVLQEYMVRKRPLYEVIGQIGFWGTIINGIQAAALEHSIWADQTWNGPTIGILVGYTISMLCLYTVAPLIFRLASSPFYNISILTSDFYGLIFGFGLYHYEPYWLYFVAYILTLAGLMVYFSWQKPESQGNCDVVSRGRQREVETLAQAEGRSIRIAGV